MFYHYWTDAEIAQMLLLVDPDIAHINIETKFPETPFVLKTKDGVAFEGVITAFREHAIELRQADGKIVYVLKSAVAAIHCP